MPKKQSASAESIVFNGITFRRYPNSLNISDQRYYRANGGLRKKGISYLHHEVWKYYHGEIPKGYHIHHKDGDTLNNSIDNLEALPGREHLSEHNKERGPSEYFRIHFQEMQEKAKAWHKSAEGIAWHSEHGKKIAAQQKERKIVRICLTCGEAYEALEFTKNFSKFCSKKCKAKWRRDNGMDDETRICPVCGKSFRVNRYSKTKTCGAECGWRSGSQQRRKSRCVQLNR